MSGHHCDALVVACIDFRFQKYIRSWTDRVLVDKLFDYVGYAGSTKDLDILMKQLDISVRLHEIKEVHLIHHEDCGAYGIQGTSEKHKADLQKAKKEILTKYPKLNVSLYYLHIDSTFEEVK